MRISGIVLWSGLLLGITSGSWERSSNNDQARRQVIGPGDLPTLGAGTSTATTTTISRDTTGTATVSTTGTRQTSSGTSASSDSERTTVISTASSAVSNAPSSTSQPQGDNSAEGLPLPPRITPALSIAGAFLMLSGIVYSLIGVRNRWMHIFLSTGYLTSLSICVLILYVMNPPVSNAIQGAYFVGIFMTGMIFGAGALIFKEITEGLGCLLGGFCLAMWFLTLKSGGLITDTTGKAVFISIFCALAWALSFSHYTRVYALIGSVSFSGATVFVLGVDCFSKGGLKEFWVFIWNLNPDLFPLNTNTYPITRGTRVETIVILLGCIVGVISQMKLWKVIADRQRRKKEEDQEDRRRQEAVEVALGKHLERRNDKDKSEWERQYGNTLQAKRETILWSEAHGEKRSKYSRISEAEIAGSHTSASSESLEMKSLRPSQPRSVYVARVKRQSSMNVDAIPEIAEPELVEDSRRKESEQQRSLARLEGHRSTDMIAGAQISRPDPVATSGLSPTSGKIAHSRESGLINRDMDVLSADEESMGRDNIERHTSAHLNVEDRDAANRRSWSSRFSVSGKDNVLAAKENASQEGLMLPSAPHSRASSLAATLNSENDRTSIAHEPVSAEGQCPSSTGIASKQVRNSTHAVAEQVPVPPALEEESHADPEEFIRPPVENTAESKAPRVVSDSANRMRKGGLSSDNDNSAGFESGSRSDATSSETSMSEVLTKGALDQVPNHLSHVVMSYRTNEWAKHIATADAPVYEEPSAVREVDIEEPAHLVHPEEAQRHSVIMTPPPLDSLPSSPLSPAAIEAATLSPVNGIRANPSLQPTQLSATYFHTTPSASALSLNRIGSQSDTKPYHGTRSVSNSIFHQHLVSSPIDEHSATNFPPHTIKPMKSSSVLSMNRLSGEGSGTIYYNNSNNLSQPMLTQYTAASPPLSQSHSRPNLIYGQPVNSSDVLMRSRSQLSLNALGNARANRSDTRLASYDSHQPSRRNSDMEQQRRQALFAEWRMSQQKRGSQQEHGDDHRMHMVLQRQQAKQQEEQERDERARIDSLKDMRMRGRDMQELHREAMKRLQAGANQHIQK